MVKLRRITLYRIMPIVLISVLLFSICLCSNVFSPKPARAIVGEEFIVPAFYAWLNTMNVYLSTYDSSPSDTQYLSNGVWNTLVNIANSQNWLSSAAWTLATLAVELEDRISTAFDNNGNGFFQLDQETSTLFDSATRQFIIDNSLSSDVSTPVNISSDTGLFLLDGSDVFKPVPQQQSTFPRYKLYYLADNYSPYLTGTVYTLMNGTQFYTDTTNTLYVYYVDQEGSEPVQITTAVLANNTGDYFFYKYYDGNYGMFTEKPFNSSDNIQYNNKSYVHSSLSSSIISAFGSSTTIGYEATTGTIVQNPTLPDDENDEYGYVGVPNGVAWGASSTGIELLQSMLDYERDKPYSSTSEYTYAISNEVPIQPEPDQPGMVELPLIGIQLPTNFSLNLRGIWYYVVQWVNSIRSWFTWMFGVFANLPYAMVVPIYASAVVVIVLGVYKRFFM